MTKKLTTVFVFPVAGRRILMPERAFQPVPAEGARVYLDAFYARTIQQGDLTVGTAPAASTAAPAPAAALASAPAAVPLAPAPIPVSPSK